jgi:hypothetical protein
MKRNWIVTFFAIAILGAGIACTKKEEAPAPSAPMDAQQPTAAAPATPPPADTTTPPPAASAPGTAPAPAAGAQGGNAGAPPANH